MLKARSTSICSQRHPGHRDRGEQVDRIPEAPLHEDAVGERHHRHHHGADEASLDARRERLHLDRHPHAVPGLAELQTLHTRGNGDDRRRPLGEGTERDCSTCSSGSTWNHQPIAPIRASASPTMPTTTWVTSAAMARVRPRANTMGHTVGAGSVWWSWSWTAHRPISRPTVKTTTHTPSTKCQYQDTISTRSAWAARSAPVAANTQQRPSMTSPTITCEPCSPTSG